MIRLLSPSLALVATLVLAAPVHAGHHRWDITELFTTADGSVQFVEMFSGFDNEAGLGPFTLTSDGNVFNFVTNLPSSSTANTWALIATADFAALPGAPTPDYTIPAGFLNATGGTVNYAGGADVVVHGALPTDGVTSVDDVGATGTNSPTNFAGASGSVVALASTPVDALPRVGLILLVGATLLLALRAQRRLVSTR